MLGGFIIHPKTAYAPRVDKDYLISLQEYAVLPNSTVPNSMNMEFNWLTFNGKAGPASTPLVVREGERVRIRFINMGMDHHPIHLHGFTFWETGREAARQQESAWVRGNTVLVGVAQARDIEFVADRRGDWMLHCHLPHHMMNQMSSNVGPITRRRAGMQAGASMEDGMGMLRDGNATSENRGPSLGRGLGVGSTTDLARSNGPLSQREADHGSMQGMSGMQMPEVSRDANEVPLFPQDAFMEGPMMAMDKRGGETGGVRTPSRMERFCGRHDDACSCAPRRPVRRDHGAQGEARREWRSMNRISLTLLKVVAATALLSNIATAQDDRKTYTLRGTVTEVNTGAKKLGVSNEPIAGGMAPMTMNYSVSGDEVFSRVKAGDRITAKMRQGDMTLYDLQIIPPAREAISQEAATSGMGIEEL